MKHLQSVGMTSLLIGLAFFSSCKEARTTILRSKPKTPVIELTTTNVEVSQSYVADIQAVQYVNIKSKVGGFVETIYVDEGEHVGKGQLLFKLSSDELAESVREAEANHKRAEAELKMAEVESFRIKRLVDKNILSPIRLEQAQAEVDVARLKVQQAKSRLTRMRTNLSYTRITAPFDGYIDRIPFKTGSLVTPNSLLTSVTDVKEVFAYFKVNEMEYLQIKRDQLSGERQNEMRDLELILSDQTTYPYKGSVETVEGDFERGTGSIAFRARFINPDRLLRHGVSGKIQMKSDMKNVLLVPQQSTFEIQDFTYVYTVNDKGKVSVRSFIPITRQGDFYVTHDLPNKTRIVYEGVQQIKDGMTIDPELVDLKKIEAQKAETISQIDKATRQNLI